MSDRSQPESDRVPERGAAVDQTGIRARVAATGPSNRFKQSDVGLIPDEWDVHSIGNSLKLINGRAFKPEDWRTRGTPIIRIQNLNDPNGAFNYCDTPIADKHLVVPGDILFAWSGTTGTSFGARQWKGEVGVLNQHIFKVIADPQKLTPFYSLLILQRVQEDIEKQAHGFKASFVHVKKTDLVKVPLPIPPLIEQEAIGEVLADVNALLEKLDRLIAKKRDLKQAAMQQLLTGQTRLGGFRGRWDDVSLGELFSFKNGLNKGKEYFGFGTPIVNYMDVFRGGAMRSASLSGRVSLTNEELKNFDVRKGDVFFTRTSETAEEIGMASVMLDEPTHTVFSGFVLRGRPKTDRLCDAFKAYCFASAPVRRQIISKASYTTRALTNGRILSGVILSAPPLDEQAAIAAALSDLDAELSCLEQRRDKGRALKQGMMQGLLTGRIRLV